MGTQNVLERAVEGRRRASPVRRCWLRALKRQIPVPGTGRPYMKARNRGPSPEFQGPSFGGEESILAPNWWRVGLQRTASPNFLGDLGKLQVAGGKGAFPAHSQAQPAPCWPKEDINSQPPAKVAFKELRDRVQLQLNLKG